jgi:hypothetical protein
MTTTTVTITSTVTYQYQTPVVPSPRARAVRRPNWLENVPTELICPACKMVWQPPPPKTVSIRKMRTVSSTKTTVVTSDALTITQTTTIIPPARTLTQIQTITLVFTESHTFTPLTTVSAYLIFQTFNDNTNVTRDNIHRYFDTN